MEEWKPCKMEDVCKKVTSGGTPLTSKKEYYENGTIPWLKTTEVHKEIIYNSETYITEDGLKNSSAKLVPANSILIAMYGDGQTAGKAALTKIPVTTNQAYCNLIVDETKAHYGFIYYYLKANYDNLISLKSGGSQQNLNALTIRKFPISLPPLPSQQHIASILSAYDELIEVNYQRIKLLEETARQLYKEWFVRMRFPGYEITKFDKGIPEGWEIKKVGNAFSVLGGGTPSTEIEDYWNGNINWFTPTDVTGSDSIFLSEGTDKITEKGLKKSSASLFPPYSIMMTSRATIGAVGINTAYSCTNQGFITCLPNEELPYTYLYHWICSNKETFEMLASGSTFLEITKGTFKKIPILIPEKDVIDKYHKIVDPLFNQINILQQQNTQLRQIRDRLLPRLITGKLKVQMETKGTVIPMTVPPALNIAAEEKATHKKSNPYFKRRVLAAYIIDKLKDQSTFGHVKLMKLMFLCEYLVKIETASNYHRDAAGPYDNKMMRSIDEQLKKSNWFEAIKMQRENYTCYIYKPLAMCSEYNEWFEKYYADKKNLIDELMLLFGTQKTQKVEMVATLYKAWLDLSKQQDYVSEAELVYEVLNNWHDSKKQIDESRWRKCIVWMNNKQWITT